MSKIVRLETLEEFVKWAMKQRSDARFILNDLYSRYEHPQFQLQEAGTGSKWNSMKTIHIPLGVGQALKVEWKTNKYNRFVGMRNMKAILRIVGHDDHLVTKYKSYRLEIERRQAAQVNRNRASYALDRVTAIERELSQLNETLAELSLPNQRLVHKPQSFLSDLEDVKAMLEGYIEVTK